ncbi:Protein of unknown function (DUF3529) [Gloeocapsa sp. PCC 73106]|nr:Protein of unknown function (DUF3529) [Gloeocapsa sp. PCC 73106]
MVGLFFFIRASVKERIEELVLISKLPEETLKPQLQNYFESRAYRIKTLDAQNNRVVFEGFVRPSWFLAILLSVLAAFGLLSLALVISLLNPHLSFLGLIFPLLAPVAGIFYWKNAGRLEEVVLQIKSLTDSHDDSKTQIEIKAHRDELLTLQKSLKI